MNAPITAKPTKKAFHFPKTPDSPETASAEPVEAAATTEKPAATKPFAARKASKSKRTAAPVSAKPVAAAEKPAATKPASTKKASKTQRAAAPVSAAPTTATTAAAEKPAVTKPAATKKATKTKHATATKTEKVSAPPVEAKSKRAKKDKVVRDSFTMPKSDYEKIASLKQKCLDAGVSVKKSELLRAGLLMLEAAAPKRLLAAVAAVEAVKTGRPVNE